MKTHLTKRILALLLTLALVLSLIPMTFAEEAKSNDLVILYTNDVHCGVDQNDDSIGVAGLAKVKKELEATHENVALVDNGDFIQGELIGTVSRGEYLVQIMNYLGYDYGTFGNHEYDYTMPQLKTLVDMANMTYLSCNFQYIGPGEDPNAVDVDGYKVVDYDGLKVGYVGITTPESLVKSTPTYFQDENGEWIYTFCNGGEGQELYDAVQAAVDAARAEGAQVVVALAHLGIDEQSSPWMSTEVIANTTGIDVMLDGHSHSTIARQEVANKNGETVLLSSTGTKLANIGKLTVTPEGAVNTELIARADVDGVDEDTQAYLEQIEAQYEELTHQVVAHVDYDLLTTDPDTGARMVRMRETNLGDVCADAYRTVLDADIAFVNGGGVRANIPAGDVTYEQIIKVHPYSNMACKIKTTGQQILDALEMASRNVTVDENGDLNGENGGFLQVAGLKYTINADMPSTVVVDDSKMFVEVAGERRVEDVQVLQADGSYAPIDPEGEYSLASHNYMLKQAGDGLNMFMHDELLLDEVKVDNQVLIEYMTSDDFAAHDYSDWKGEGRINIISANNYVGKTVILHTNDTHGALMGFAQVAKVKADYEAQGAEVILVDAGDFSQGTTYVSTNKGAAAVTMMNAAGYDYVTFGNHEFDFGRDQLKQNMSSAEFTPVCSNIMESEPFYESFLVREVGGVRIGFFGLETPETQTKVNPGLIQGIEFLGGQEMYATAEAVISALRELDDFKADLVICLAHLGVDDESADLGNRSIDLYANVTGIDFIIDGHSHTVMTEGPNGEPIQSTGTKASKTALMNVGCIVIDNETKTIEDHYLIPLGEDAPVDEEVAALAQEIMDEVDAEYGTVFAYSAVELNGDRAPGNRNMETNLGDLITDALRWSVMKDMSAEVLGVPEDNVVAITNGGGIRAWIHEGDVTKNDINTVLPFGNTVAVVYVTGAELLEALEASTYCTPNAVGGFPQISGMNITIDVMKTFDQGDLYPASTYHAPNSIRRVTINDVNGKPFDPEATYAVVTNNFCAAGGDTYYVFQNASSQFDTGIPMDEALIEFIMDPTFMNGYISDFYAEPQGRITIWNGFDDVQNPDKYYYEPVYWAYDHEPQITAGIGDNLFGKNEPCTREQIVTFLWKALGEPEPTITESPFEDVQKPSKYYYKAVLWALENGVTSGVDETHFGVKQPCTREQVVTFLWNALGKPEPKLTESPFEDVQNPNKYYYKAVLWALENEITAGVDETHFGVKQTCTRAQIVTFLYKAMHLPEPVLETSFEFLVTSDLHGQIYATDYTAPYEQSGTYKRGLTRVATYIKEQKELYGDNLYVVDMGDTFQGAPLTYYYAFNKPEEKDPAILAFRTIGYDMWVVGNHEFNYGLEILNRQMAYAVSEGDENEKQLTISLANYLDAATNSDESKDWATWKGYEPYVIKDFGGYKVAVIGFGNPNIPKWDVPANWEGIYFANIIETYKHYEAEMLEQADMIVVVAHSGLDSDPGSDFIAELVASTNTIAFAFSGHEHRNAITPIENLDGKEISVLSPYTKARAIAQVQVEVNGDEITVTPELKNMEGYPIDEELAELLKPYETETWENYMLQPIGVALGDYPAANLGTAPSAFMDLINTVQTWGAYDRGGVNTPDNPADDTPAMLSISAPLTSGDKENLIPEGEIYLGDMFGLYRFENWFYQITMTGEEVHQWLEFAATKIQIDDEGNPYVTSGDLTYYDVIMGDGFHYDIDVSKPEGGRVINMTYQGEPVAADQEFTVVVNNYRYNGGGNYVNWLNDHGCEFIANDPDRVIYSTQFDMIQGEDEGQARALLVSYIKEQTAANGGITPFITSDWTVQYGYIGPDEEVVETTFPSTSNSDIEKYGNIYTDLDAAAFFDAGYTWGDVVMVKFRNQVLSLAVVPTYSYVDQGTAAVIVGKDGETGEPVGRVKMAINMGNFADAYGLATKSTVDGNVVWTPCEGVEFPVPVIIKMEEQGGYMAELLLHDINRTNNREDYPNLTDEEFANFRRITTTGMGDHLYRGSSPINPEIGRNTYADAALENAGVTVIMNLANNQEEAEGYEGYADTYYAGQNIIFLNLGVDFQAADFQAGLADGLRFFAENEGVYYVHCTEGKDRAGFVSALLECLMGATADEVVEDYLKTYENYYTVVDGVQQPLSEETLQAIADSNIIKSLKTAFGVSDLETADLAAEAEAYIAAIGLNDEEIEALKANLGGASGGDLQGYVPAESVAVGDQILYVVECDGTLYAMTNDTSVSNALNVAEVTVNADGVIETAPAGAVWTLEAGTSGGSFVLKDEDGKYLSNPSSTSLKLGESKSEFTAACGAGTSAFNLVTTSATARRIFLRNNNGVLQFRCYAISNAGSEGYSSVLTIYKYNP